MNYEDFKRYITDHVKEFLTSEYQGCKVSVAAQRKNNNVVFDVLVIRENSQLVPAISLEPYYQKYKNGVGMERILKHIADTYMERMEQVGSFSLECLQYERVKDRIFVTVQNAEKNTEFLKDVPHEIREDLALIYRFDVEMSDEQKGTVVINNRQLAEWGITEKALKETAWKNMHEYFRPVFFPMGNLMKQFEVPELQKEAEQMEIYVLTNEESNYGAAYMFDKELMNEIAKELESDLVVVPSSVHEVILLKNDIDLNMDELEALVQEVNREELKATETLSDHLYQYSRQTQSLSRMKNVRQEEIVMPDPKVSVKEMHEYGYTWDGMLPLTKKRALELMDTELLIYKLHKDGAEGLADNSKEIIGHQGLFGVEKESWLAYQKEQNQEQAGGMTQNM